MDSNTFDDKNPSLLEDGSLPAVQINPLSLMTSLSSYKPVDDNQENILESTGLNQSDQSIDVAVSSTDKNDSKDNNNKKSQMIVHMDENAVAAWVQSTANESITSPIERSPSLPSTIIEQITVRSRRESTVSTLCEQQQQQQQQQLAMSIPSDTLSSTISQNLSNSNDYQRSFSFPLVDQHQYEEKNDIRFIQEENDEDICTEFLPVQESEDSEIEKKTKKTATPESLVTFNSRSPIEDQPKKPSKISFHTSVSFDPTRKLVHHRQRHNSWNKTKTKPVSYHRSQSHKIHSQINHQSFLATASASGDARLFFPGHKTNQSSSFSDNVFLSTSTTNSPSSSHHLHLTNHPHISSQFLSLPSSASVLSSEILPSNVSDASGQSGIESSNLRTSASEPPFTASINEDDSNDGNYFFSKQQRTSSVSSRSSVTASTESLPTSSSEDEGNNFRKKLNTLNKFPKTPQTPAQQRLDVLKQLMWLLEKRPTINPRANLIRHQPLQKTSPVK